MFKTLTRSALVVLTLAAGAAGLSAAPAAAQPARITVGTVAGSDIVVAQRYERRDERRYDRRGVCAPRQALRKAARMGLRRAVIVRDNRRAVVVDGRKRGRLATVRFAQARGCPVIGVR